MLHLFRFAAGLLTGVVPPPFTGTGKRKPVATNGRPCRTQPPGLDRMSPRDRARMTRALKSSRQSESGPWRRALTKKPKPDQTNRSVRHA
jgi:hypothetical protein